MDRDWLRANIFIIFFVFFLLTWVAPIPSAAVGVALVAFGGLVGYVFVLEPGLDRHDQLQLAYLAFALLSAAAGVLLLAGSDLYQPVQIAALAAMVATLVLSSRRL